MKREIGQLIKKYRESKQLTQATLSKLSGVSEVSIGLYETGARTPKLAQIEAIANGLQVSPNLLLNMEISTKGEVADLLFRLDESVDIELVEQEDGKVVLEFSNPTINDFLAEWLAVRRTAENISFRTGEADKERTSIEVAQLKDTFYMGAVCSNYIVEKGKRGMKVAFD